VRYLLVLSLPFALAAQSPESDQRVTQTLISEIHELRLAIERSTLLNARTQLAISQLQMQETAVARLSTQLNDTRAASQARRLAMIAEHITEREGKRNSPEFAAPPRREQLEGEIRNMKDELTMVQAMEGQRAAREGDLAAELLRVQNQIGASRARIDEMERALDGAIQQLLKRP
jgi:hypothetical protein